jgi:hypothetical protein
MGFFNLYKPREYGYRYIYYDPKKEEKKAKEKERAIKNGDEPYNPTLKRGVFREMADKNKNYRVEQMRKSNLRLVIILFAMLAILYYLLSY